MLRSARLSPILFASLALAACGSPQNSPENDQAATPIIRPAESGEASLPTVDRPLERRDLLLAVAEAGSNHALGLDDKAEQQKLDGRTFTLRIRLCGDAANLAQSFDEARRVLKVEVKPDLAMDSAIVRQVSPQAVAVEGFWIPHPYFLQPGCPRAAAQAPAEGQPPAPPVRQMVGIAQLFGPEDRRADQRGSRPYSITEELAEGEAPEAIDLILQGRLERAGSGKAITCVDSPAGDQPACLISARFDRVRMETLSGRSLGEWSRS
ncbi:hypothetical protein GGQ97_000443 [Sphingomonas kaistensis]|uniref:Uncharacterized protein n=1 Tax=Sphingomonas kaistensis TaxID=298708 RepID=A0A7X5Y4K5_9SPHN|nr:hypothetical protein [Sphingomonas kaistensis]NJC04650.1 hypothetical protein [Sphingomonas kaistensis]